MAKPKPINKLLNRDYPVFEAMRCVGHLSEEQLLNELGIARNRIERYIASGWFKKDVLNRTDGTRVVSYTPTRKGFEFMREKLHYVDIYKPQSVEHDVALGERYFELSEDERKGWITETQQQRELNELYDRMKQEEPEQAQLYKDYSACDGGYINSSGEVCLIEIVTSTYTKDMIEAKHSSAALYGSNYYEWRV